MADICHNNGDGDLYGIGVRIGLYLQWVAGFLLRNSQSSWRTVSAVRVANNALGISIMITLIVNTSRGLTLVTDFLITYYLTIALFYSESYNLLNKKGRYILQPDVPLLFQNFLFSAASLFGGWFWIRGVPVTARLECGSARAAVIASFDLHNSHWKAFAATMSILVGIIFAFFFFAHLYIFYSGHVGSEPLVAVAGAFKAASGVGKHELRGDILGLFLRPSLHGVKCASFSFGALRKGLFDLFHFFVINLAGPIIAISSVETMIRQNHIVTDGVFESTGQMIALIAGISSLCLAGWDSLSTRRGSKPSAQMLIACMRHGTAHHIGDAELRELQEYLTERLITQSESRSRWLL